MTATYTGLGQLLTSDNAAVSENPYAQCSATESTTYDPLGNWLTRASVDQWDKPYSGTATGGFSTLGTHTAHYDAGSGRLKGELLDGNRTDTLRYDAAGNLHATVTVNAGSPTQYSERVSYYALDGRLVAADARSGGGTSMLGHTAFEEYRYDALGRRVWVRARRWCSDQSGAGYSGDEVNCDLSTVRRTVWRGSQELAEIQMPAADATPSDTVENDTLAVHRQRSAVMADPFYDANRFFGVVLNVQGPGLDQPVAVTRVNYADASDLHTGAVTYAVYAPHSLIGLWNNQGRVDRVVYGGTAAPGQTALCVDPGTQYRCAFPGIDWGEFHYLRSGQDAHTWQGTVMVDKPDATGTYYRRNRSYDPNTARFTQEDPLGLAGGLNVYGFASGDPVDFSDPFGLDPCLQLGNCTQAQEGRVGAHDEQVISGLKSRARGPARQVLKDAGERGITLVITEGYRSPARQDALYAQGRTTPGRIVTNARAGQSAHQSGLAMDVYPARKGKPNFEATPSEMRSTVGDFGKANGFIWGGDWHSIKDYPHLELPRDIKNP